MLVAQNATLSLWEENLEQLSADEEERNWEDELETLSARLQEPVNINAANLLLLFIISFSSLIIEIRKGAGVFLQRLCLVRIINLMKQLCNVNFAQFVCAVYSN